MAPPRSTPARAAQTPSAQARAPRTDQTGDDLRGVLEPVVTAAGFELDTLDVRAVGHRHTIRLVVDSDAGVGLDDIARISRRASDQLDQNEHLVGGSYTLEVTSPGVDRPLTTPRHWRRARLRLVGVRPRVGDPFEGRVGDAGDDAVTLLVGGALREVRYADVVHAAVEVEFAPPPEKDLALLDPGRPLDPGAGAAPRGGHVKAAEDPE
jgi:ribosome maturation factor RimP